MVSFWASPVERKSADAADITSSVVLVRTEFDQEYMVWSWTRGLPFRSILLGSITVSISSILPASVEVSELEYLNVVVLVAMPLDSATLEPKTLVTVLAPANAPVESVVMTFSPRAEPKAS